MLEMKITVAAPELAAAINNLAAAYAATLEKKAEDFPVKPENPSQGAPAIQPTAAPASTAPTADPAQAVPPAPVNPTQAQSVQAPATAPNVQPYTQTPPAQAYQAAPTANPVPTSAPQYTLEMLATAGSALIDAGKADQLTALLAKYGVDSLVNFKPEAYGAVAMDLRAMGARI